jgi:hypothetical protein
MLKFGRLEDGTRINADVASKDNKHFCPGCGAPLVLKQGEINAWHFAHESGSECDAFTESKMTDWHIKHQEMFPEENREVRLERDGVVHIADIAIDGLIIEFQHSPMNNEVFEERCNFYSSFGRLLWVFDFREQWKNDNIIWVQKNVESDYGYFEWRYPQKMLGQYDFAKSAVDLFIEIDDTGWGCLVNWNPNGMKFFNGKRLHVQQLHNYISTQREIAPYSGDGSVLEENERIIKDREEAREREEIARRYAEEKAKMEKRRKDAEKEADFLIPIIRQLELDEQWARSTLSDVQAQLKEHKSKLNHCQSILRGTA